MKKKKVKYNRNYRADQGPLAHLHNWNISERDIVGAASLPVSLELFFP